MTIRVGWGGGGVRRLMEKNNLKFPFWLFETVPKIHSVLNIPRVGGAEKLKLHETIPPFSLIEDSIQGKKADTLVKTAKSCWSQVSPSLLLTIPARTWEPSLFTTVSGPPLSPWAIDIQCWQNEMLVVPCMVRYFDFPHRRWCFHWQSHFDPFSPSRRCYQQSAPLSPAICL